MFESALALWIAGAAGVVWWFVNGIRTGDAPRRTSAIAIALLAIAGFLAVCLPGQFWPHNYYLLVPTLAIVATMAIAQIVQVGASLVGVSPAVNTAVRTAAYVVLVLLTLATQYRHYLSQPLERITIKRYNSRDFWGRAQGENVRRVTKPGDTVFVFGNDTGIYYYSHRRCASQFTMITGLQTRYQGAASRRAILLEELERTRPRVIIVLFDEQPFDGWLALLDRYYGEAVGVDYHDRTRKPIMLVFARKDQPIESINWDWTHAIAREEP